LEGACSRSHTKFPKLFCALLVAYLTDLMKVYDVHEYASMTLTKDNSLLWVNMAKNPEAW
jgi:hypothetical protein